MAGQTPCGCGVSRGMASICDCLLPVSQFKLHCRVSHALQTDARRRTSKLTNCTFLLLISLPSGFSFAPSLLTFLFSHPYHLLDPVADANPTPLTLPVFCPTPFDRRTPTKMLPDFREAEDPRRTDHSGIIHLEPSQWHPREIVSSRL